MKPTIILLTALLLAGCSALAPHADPIVVRAEQTETIAYATFDVFLKLDDANRALVNSNAPAVHAFAEKLRAPVLNGTNLTRVGLQWIASLDSVKQAYKAGHATSNDLVTALSVVESAVIEAQKDIATYGGAK